MREMFEYFARLTPYASATLDDVRDVIDTIGCPVYVISIEQANRVHFHLYLRTLRTSESLRYQLKQRINGQVYISGRQVVDKVKAIAYTIKDGSYIHKGLDVNTLLMAEAVTHPKRTFDSAIKEIDSSNKSVVLRSVIRLYKEFDRKPYLQHIEALARQILLRNDANYETYLCNLLEDRI